MQFKEHSIDQEFRGAYGLAVADMNGNGRKDIVVGSITDPVIAWYESPHWQKHLITDQHPGNITIATHDLTGNSIPDLIVGSGFNRRQRVSVEYLHWLEAPNGSGQWTSHYIDEIPFLHRIGLADINGDGQLLLFVASIRGAEGEFNEWHDPGALWCYQIPSDPINQTWQRRLIDNQLHLNHGLSFGDVDRDGRLDILIGCRDGLIWFEPPSNPFTERWHKWIISDCESSEVFTVDLDGDGINEILSIEPWHGNTIAWYKASGNLRRDKWLRHEIDNTLNRGHALHAVDLDNDGKIEIITGYNGKGTSLQLYRHTNLSQNQWEKVLIDHGGLGVGLMVIDDLNHNGRMDIVAGGLSTNNLKWYENFVHQSK